MKKMAAVPTEVKKQIDSYLTKNPQDNVLLNLCTIFKTRRMELFSGFYWINHGDLYNLCNRTPLNFQYDSEGRLTCKELEKYRQIIDLQLVHTKRFCASIITEAKINQMKFDYIVSCLDNV